MLVSEANTRGSGPRDTRFPGRPDSGLSFRLCVRILAGSLLIAISGCGCIKTPSARLEQIKHEEDEAAVEAKSSPAPDDESATSSEPSEAGTGDAWRSRYQSLLEAYSQKRCNYVVSDGLTVLGYDIPGEIRLEVCLMLSECYHTMGDQLHAQEFKERYQKEFKAVVDSPEWKSDREAGASMHKSIARLKKAARTEDPFSPAGEESRLAVRLAKQLQEGTPGQVHNSVLPDGGEVFFSTDRDKLLEQVTAPGQDDLAAAVQHDPEYGFFFTIRETPPKPPQRR